MAQALRFVSIERGLDPGDFVLVAFGGAGPLHAASVARELGVAGVLIPYSPGVLCAMGVLTKDVQMDFSRTRIMGENARDCCAAVSATYRELEQKARSEFAHSDGAAGGVAIERSADARYAGQNHELSVAVPPGNRYRGFGRPSRRIFTARTEQRTGYRSPERALEFVTCRVKATRAIRNTICVRAAGAGADAALRRQHAQRVLRSSRDAARSSSIAGLRPRAIDPWGHDRGPGDHRADGYHDRDSAAVQGAGRRCAQPLHDALR
jgi:N-methylhydantoinase A